MAKINSRCDLSMPEFHPECLSDFCIMVAFLRVSDKWEYCVVSFFIIDIFIEKLGCGVEVLLSRPWCNLGDVNFSSPCQTSRISVIFNILDCVKTAILAVFFLEFPCFPPIKRGGETGKLAPQFPGYYSGNSGKQGNWTIFTPRNAFFAVSQVGKLAQK